MVIAGKSISLSAPSASKSSAGRSRGHPADRWELELAPAGSEKLALAESDRSIEEGRGRCAAGGELRRPFIVTGASKIEASLSHRESATRDRDWVFAMDALDDVVSAHVGDDWICADAVDEHVVIRAGHHAAKPVRRIIPIAAGIGNPDDRIRSIVVAREGMRERRGQMVAREIGDHRGIDEKLVFPERQRRGGRDDDCARENPRRN